MTFDLIYKNNNEYNNSSISNFVEDILSPERVGDSGYVTLGDFNYDECIFSPCPDFIKEEIKNVLLSPEIFGYEKLVLSNLLYGNKTNYVLAGAMGSGKTALIRYLEQYIEKNHSSIISIIYLNFHEGFPTLLNADQTFSLFKSLLINQLKAFIYDIFIKNDGLFDEFLLLVRNDYKSLHMLYNHVIRTINICSQKNYLLSERIVCFFDQIHNESHIDEWLISYFQILKVLKLLLSKIQKKIILFFDNLDGISSPAQKDILDSIITYNEISQIKSLIALRRSSYQRLFGKANYDYGYFHHYGPFPQRILRKRLLYWKDKLDLHPLTTLLDDNHKKALYNRISYILKDTSSKKSYTNKYLDSLSGRSVRLGLYLSQRLFINNVFPYDDDSNWDNLIARSLLVGKEEHILPNDVFILNIFQKPNFCLLSLLPLRILQILKEFFTNSPHLMKFRYVISILRSLAYNDDPDILSCFNILFNIEKPLLWIDSIYKFDSIEQMEKLDDKIFFTEIGLSYYDNLLIDLNYIQECFLSIPYSDFNIISYGDDSIYDRFDYILKCLSSIHDLDYKEILNYSKSDSIIYINKENIELFSNRIIYNIFKSFMSITKSHDIEAKNEKYFLDWKSKITLCFNHSFSNKSKTKMNNCLNEIDDRLAVFHKQQ